MNVLSSKMDTRPRRMMRGGSPGLLAGSSVASLLESIEEDGGRGMFPVVCALGISPFTLEQSLFMQCQWWGLVVSFSMVTATGRNWHWQIQPQSSNLRDLVLATRPALLSIFPFRILAGGLRSQ